jgi:hypothetical protein
MRVGIILISVGLLAGCSTEQPQTTMLKSNANLGNASAALVFDPPIAMNQPPLDLSRSTRGEAAFAGFEETTTTYFDVRTDDRQTTDLTDQFVREGYSEQVGSTRR